MTEKTRTTQQGTAFDTKQSKQKMTPGLANHTSEAEQSNQKAGESPIEESTKKRSRILLVLAAMGPGIIAAMADLVREIHLPIEMDYMAISSYGNGAKSSGVVRILKDLTCSIEDSHVLIAEDILDSGLTLRYLMKNLESRNPASLQVATLLRKDTPNQADIPCKYIGFECPDEFIVGYGLDYAERYRNLPCIGVLKPEIIE